LNREYYILAAFSIHSQKAIKYRRYLTLDRRENGVSAAMERGADFVILRRIRPEAGNWRPSEKEEAKTQ